MASQEVTTAEQARRDMNDLTSLFFGLVRHQINATTDGFEIQKINSRLAMLEPGGLVPEDRAVILNIEELIAVKAAPGTYWQLSLPKEVVELATVQTLVEGDPSTTAYYEPNLILSITSMRASIYSARQSLLSFLESPDEEGRRRMMQVGADGPIALGVVAERIHPHTMLIPGHFEEA
jgi:hypothetical protein